MIYKKFNFESGSKITEENNLKNIKKIKEKSTKTILSKELEIGQKVYGTVINIKPYGAFIKIKSGEVGLLHIEDISVARIKSPEERLHIGQKIPVIVKSIDDNAKKFNLSYKEILGTWQDNIKDIKVGQELQGTIRETAKGNKGIFIELKPNLVGMSEYKPNYNFGDKVTVIVKKIIPEKHKVKLKII